MHTTEISKTQFQTNICKENKLLDENHKTRVYTYDLSMSENLFLSKTNIF